MKDLGRKIGGGVVLSEASKGVSVHRYEAARKKVLLEHSVKLLR